jgi:gliding motility-associated-like protein
MNSFRSMNKFTFVALLCALFVQYLSSITLAQTCDNPIEICGNEPTTIFDFVEMDFTGQAIDSCLTGGFLTAVRFHTTYLSSDEGVTISLSGVDCAGTVLRALVVEPNVLDPCNTLLYNAVSNCESSSEDFTFTTSDLFINTDYLILISIDTEAIKCGFIIEAYGEPLSIEACCPTNIAYLESTTLEVMGGDGGLGYVWSPSKTVDNPTEYSVVVTPTTTTAYEVTGFVEQCEYSDQVLVVVGTDIDVPNAFSPNDDGINDYWKITGLSSYTRSRLTLYDRWGQEVLRSIAYPQPWNGKRSSNKVPAGTYYYIIELNEPGVDLDPITGNVAVIR